MRALFCALFSLSFTSLATAQCALEMFLDEGPLPTNFGISTAISGDRIIVGGPRSDGFGRAHIYVRSDDDWSLEDVLSPSVVAFADLFAWDVALDGDVLVAGAPNDDTFGVDAGAVYVFENTSTGWELSAKIFADDALEGAQFGNSTAVSGDRIVVGGLANSRYHYLGGGAYVFEREGETWSQVTRLMPLDPGLLQHFGNAVDIEGRRVIIGAEWDSELGSRTGAVYVFELEETTWTQTAKILSPAPTTSSHFGSALDLDGERLIVGMPAPFAQPMAFVFEEDGDGNWMESANLLDENTASLDFYAAAVALDDDRALVGAWGYDDGGTVYLYERAEDGDWQETARLIPDDLVPGSKLGVSVALAGRRAVLGADGFQSFDGTAYLFDLDGGRTETYCSSTPNSSGVAAHMLSEGAPVLATNEFALVAEGCPSGVLGLFIAGRGAFDIPFGNGRLCLSPFEPGIKRVEPIVTVDETGRATLPIDIATPTPGLTFNAGAEWRFQFLFRDPAPETPGAFNLTDGLRVVFCP